MTTSSAPWIAELDNRKGPKRKSPWIVDGDVCMGDTELILEHVGRTRAKVLDAGLSAEERARSIVLRLMLEEHYHRTSSVCSTRASYTFARCSKEGCLSCRWFVTDAPTKADASALGLLAVSIRSPLETPVCRYARSRSNLVAFVDRGMARFFGESRQGLSAAA